MDDIVIHKASQDDLPVLRQISEDMRAEKISDYFERNLEMQDKGMRDLYIVSVDGQAAGYGILNWHPKYVFFKRMNMPEIQDLNIVPDFRRQGLARKLIHHCEGLAKDKGASLIGISVGLNVSFGPAQRLYVSLGYIPDGNGVTYDRKPVVTGEIRPVDDDLCLMMVKDLAKTAAE